MPIIYVYYYRSAVMLVVFSHAAFCIPIYIPIRCSHARSSHAAFCTLQCVNYYTHYSIILSAVMLVRFFLMLRGARGAEPPGKFYTFSYL